MSESEYDPTSLAIWFFAKDKPQVNLDVGILGQLATGQVPPDRLDRWLAANDGYIALYRYHCMELANRKPPVVRKVVEFLAQRTSFLVAFDAAICGYHGRNEALPLRFFPISNANSETRDIILERIVDRDREKIRQEAREAEDMLLKLRDAIATFELSPWEGLPELARFWILLSCRELKGELENRHLHDPDYYSSFKLQMCVFLHRKLYQNTKWQDSDYADFLHCLDTAYAHFVITEKGLAESLRQINARVPGLAPPRIETIKWLRDES